MKQLFVSLCAVLISITVSSQVTLGIKGGANFSTLGGDAADFDGKKSNTGFNVGLVGNIPISTKFSFKPEILYTTSEGFEYRPTTTTELNLNLTYVNVPLLVQYKSTMGLYGEFGPYAGVLVNAKQKIKSNGGNAIETDVKDNFSDFDLGATAGIGYMLHGGWAVGGRYNMGLKNINEGNAEYKNRFWQVQLSYMFSGNNKQTKK